MKHIPNFLTAFRIFLGGISFLLLAIAGGGIPLFNDDLTPGVQFALERWALAAFAVASISDFFDGWLARKLNAVTTWGTILDPIGDKILICGSVLGLATLGPQPQIAVPAALILFREFAVSALREGSAGRGLKLAVSFLAKIKTAVQMVALGAELLVNTWAAWPLPSEPAVLGPAVAAAHALLWIAALITLWTGAQYWHRAHVAIGDN